jgi:hypothetical protein
VGEVFYAIDMGAPSGKYSGFYCWRYDLSSKKLESFDKTDGWYKCIEQIVEDSKNYQVHLTIEAALWGMKNRKSGDWVRRFNIENEKEWSERPWYTGAGASTGLMAQIFLNNIVELNPPKSRIIVRESYISGLSREGSSLTVKKPTKALVSFKTKHACDAFEGLLLTLEITKKDLKYIDFNYKGYSIDLKNWIDLKNNFFKIKMRDDEPFALGILKDTNIFTFNLGEILFTRRDFGILPKK